MNKVYLVIGGSSDIGMEFIRSSAIQDKTAKFYAHYRTMTEHFQALSKDFSDRIFLINADLSNEGGVEQMIAGVHETPSHILHLPASKIEYRRLKQTSTEYIQKEMQLQVYSLLEVYKAFLPQMAKAKYGRSVALITSAIYGMPPQFLSAYTTVKYALLGLVKSAAAEYADKGIFINAVSPSMVETKFLATVDERIVAMTAQERPLKRNIKISEVVAAISFLLADDNPMYGENLILK